jgi:hypothetical protein
VMVVERLTWALVLGWVLVLVQVQVQVQPR